MININATGTSPEIILDEPNHTLRIKGESYPENAFSFYEPVFDWFHNKFPAMDEFVLEINLSYMNSSSTKCILDILDIVNEAGIQGRKVRVDWLYDPENSRSLELAEEFKEDLEIPFEMIPF